MSSRSYPSQPIPAVGAFIIKDEEILSIRRIYEPCADKWNVPGLKEIEMKGHLEIFESRG